MSARCSVGRHTPVPIEHEDDNVHSLATDHGDHSPRTSVRSESPAIKTKGSPKAGNDEEEKAAKGEDAKLSKKCTTSKSSLREGKENDYSYRNLFGSSDEEEGKAIHAPLEVTSDLDQQEEDS
ncbi:hypothetical protein PInf_022287 [Phytophthora infestans]|nr:hypothetical protein PInf_022287 [Phytophthora infestans]